VPAWQAPLESTQPEQVEQPVVVQVPQALDHSCWTASVPTVPGIPLQMSPISPLVVSYQAIGGPGWLPEARPIAESVTDSIISCEAVTCVLSICDEDPPPHPDAQPPP
jgi:hypothetical protein